MVCIQQELNQIGNKSAGELSPPPYDQNDVAIGGGGALDSSIENNSPCQGRWTAAGAFGAGGYGGGGGGGSGMGKSTGFMYNIFGCMRPLLDSFGNKSSVIETSKLDQWEIPFVDILDMEWVGSGAQGTVFSGKLKNEIVAVKRVRQLKETDIRHLRKLDHVNIIKFK